jgi:mitochondrial fission protein ELM1
MPVVWLIDAYRAGERSQVRALVQALGWPCEIRPLEYRQWDVITHLLPGGSLRGIQRASRESLQPPWPDLVISCGVRNEPVCRWIREQSGGRCRYVHIGRPWADPSAFDLVITTPQYRVPERPNVVRNTLTLHQVSQPRMAQGAAEWADAWRDLPRPFTGVMVGGDSGPFTLGPKAATRLARQASQLAHDTGGSLLVTTSSRTSPRATGALLNALDAPHYFHAWQPGGEAGAGGGNPYWGILGTADRFIVTADSIAMLSEACASGKPVDMFDLGGMRPPAAGPRDFRLGGALYQALIRWGWGPLTRDITLVHRELVASGRAAWLGEERQPRKTEVSGDMERALRAVKALFDQLDTTCVLD